MNQQGCQPISTGFFWLCLTRNVSVYTFTLDMGRPRITNGRKRTKVFLLRLSPGEMKLLAGGARALGESLASVLRNGGLLYIHTKSKDGSQNRKEKKQ